MTDLVIDRCGIDALSDIAALCRRSIWGSPSEEELRTCLYPDDQDTTVLGDPAGGVVAVARAGGRGSIRLIVVAPDRRRAGLGRSLLAAGEQALAGEREITIGADPPYHLWPGVPATDLALCCLAETSGYERNGTNVNMEIDLKAPLPADPGGWDVAGPEHRRQVTELCSAHYPAWENEAVRALEDASLVIVVRDARVVSFCAVDVNRGGTLGPVAVRPDLVGHGLGRTAVIGALRVMRKRGHPRAEIQWVERMQPFAALGAKAGRLFHVYRKDLGAPR